MSEVDAAGLSSAMKVDWTVDPATNRSNSSPEFLHLVGEVERLISDDTASIIAGRADRTARVIMAQLAHVHKLAPHHVRVGTADMDPEGVIRGTFNWNGRFYEFTAKPSS